MQSAIRFVPRCSGAYASIISSAVSRRAFATTSPVFNAAPGSSAPVEDIQAKLKAALKAAMKGRDKVATQCIKDATADILYAQKSSSTPNEPLSNDSVITVLRKSIEKRAKAAEEYQPDHPNHLALQEEIKLLNNLLPQSLSPQAIEEKLSDIVSKLSPAERAERSSVGKVLAAFWKEVNKSEVADVKSIGKIAGELLKGK